MNLWATLSPPLKSAALLVAVLPLIFLATLYYCYSMAATIFEWELMSSSSLQFNFPMMLDKMSLTFSVTVTLISFSVMLFSVTYMSGDQNVTYFITMVMLFVLSMNFLIFVPHLIMLLMGWDGLGLTSYILVIYYQNESSLSAGMITAMTNRIGDSLLILAICWAFISTHWSFSNTAMAVSATVVFMVMIAAMTKSAQVPFSAWLPAAMAAPTPVSSLVHSSTLVTAGVYLLIRFYPSLSSMGFFNPYLLYTGLVTSMLAGIVANYENDLKKVIALSTLSQLGMMMMMIGLGQPSVAFFHLITHALFKALLFICAGTIIHSSQNNQDLRMMGVIWNSMPATAAALNVANLALCGTPFLAGFYSKDLMLELMMMQANPALTTFMIMLTICLTAAYSMRLALFSLWSPMKHLPLSIKNDESLYTFAPCGVLLLGAVSGGALVSWSLQPSVTLISLPLTLKLFALIAITLYATMSFLTYPQMKYYPFPNFMSSMWFLEHITAKSLNSKTFSGAKMLFILEQTWMETFSGGGANFAMKLTSTKLQKTQNLSMSSMLSAALMASFVLLLIMCY